MSRSGVELGGGKDGRGGIQYMYINIYIISAVGF